MLYLITAVTCPCFWPPQIPWESCMASLDLLSKKGVFFSSVSRDIKILLLREKVNCCCLLTLFLPYDISLRLPFPKPRSPFSSTPSIQVWTRPISEFAQQLSTRFSFTLADIKFYLSFDWSVGYTDTSLQAIILVTLWITITFDWPSILQLCWYFCINSKLSSHCLAPLMEKNENKWRESSFHLQA